MGREKRDDLSSQLNKIKGKYMKKPKKKKRKNKDNNQDSVIVA